MIARRPGTYRTLCLRAALATALIGLQILTLRPASAATEGVAFSVTVRVNSSSGVCGSFNVTEGAAVVCSRAAPVIPRYMAVAPPIVEPLASYVVVDRIGPIGMFATGTVRSVTSLLSNGELLSTVDVYGGTGTITARRMVYAGAREYLEITLGW